MSLNFPSTFKDLTGNHPFPWQTSLYKLFEQGDIPKSCNLPTGLGKTSVIAIWLIALANGHDVPRRLVYVVNRRTVVDQTTDEVGNYREHIEKKPELADLKNFLNGKPLPISTLRGQFADNAEWSANPSRPAVICGTVDMIGSRLLFSGYGIGWKAIPLHAGFLGQDALLVHDEAHLEPSFQTLIMKIQEEQGREPKVSWPKFQVMELTATSKTANPFQLEKADYAHPIVDQRLNAAKKLHLHELADAKKPAKEMLERALTFKNKGRAVLIFAYSVETVLEIAEGLKKQGQQVATLTGTMRGKERDELVEKPVFACFLPEPPENAATGTVYLVCTSAGEVGVNISADHLICDLSTFESMAQRLGRVNRFGKFADCEVHCYYPKAKDWDEKNPLTVPRQKTLSLLLPLEGDNVSPKKLGDLPLEARKAAFAPEPTILPVTDILFDAWALTSIRGKLPGRPPVEPYLHGLAEWQPPETQVAWREEVNFLSADEYADDRTEVLSVYPLQPRELLRERSDRAFDRLKKIAERNPKDHAWLVSDEGEVSVVELSFFLEKDNKEAIEKMTILLAPRSGGLSENGMLESSSTTADDVSETPDRRRVQGDEIPPGLHQVYEVEFPGADDEDDESVPNIWRWHVRKNTGESTTKFRHPITLAHHVGDVETQVKAIIAGLMLDASLKLCLEIAAKYHDDGKRRANFQRMLGNNNFPTESWAKSGSRKGTRLTEKYRHEFGSLREVQNSQEFKDLKDPDQQELVLHLIATHHGRARPHFAPDEAFDPASTLEADRSLASTVPRRFGQLQRKYGRWGLAYLESLLRAADWAASDNPSEPKKEGQS